MKNRTRRLTREPLVSITDNSEVKDNKMHPMKRYMICN
jgi:hypothetical protein